MSTDIVITWPRYKPLEKFLEELERADAEGLEINYRIAVEPKIRPERCYVVYDGLVRGWNRVLDVARRAEGQVYKVDSHMGSYWPAGWYIVRDPEWHSVERRVELRGFRGFRYFDRETMAPVKPT